MVEKKESLSSVIWSESFVQNPYPTFEHFREHSPIEHMVMLDGQSAWMIFNYEAGVAALKEERFIKNVSKLSAEQPSEEPKTYQHHFFLQNMLNADPPDHRRLRSLAQKAFTPRVIANLQPKIKDIANDLLNKLKDLETVDLIEAFAFPLPIIVICDLLGIPTGDRDKFRTWSDAFVDSANNPEQAKKNLPLMEEFSNYIDDYISYKQQHLKDDLISRFIEANEQGEQLTKEEIRSLVFLLIVGGHETTINLIGNGVYTLLQHPEQLDQLTKDHTLIDSAIEEILRYEGPVEFTTTRWAAEDLTFYDQHISKGELIFIAIDSANHDPQHFQDPETFDITRKYNQHLAFGKGIHHCLGAPLARLEGRVAILKLLEHYPHLQLAVKPSALQWRSGFIVRGLQHLPIKLN